MYHLYGSISPHSSECSIFMESPCNKEHDEKNQLNEIRIKSYEGLNLAGNCGFYKAPLAKISRPPAKIMVF